MLMILLWKVVYMKTILDFGDFLTSVKEPSHVDTTNQIDCVKDFIDLSVRSE